MKECIDNTSIQDLFTVESHHRNTSVIMISHNLYTKGKFTRTIILNSHYLILFNNPRVRTQISVLARQMFPQNGKFLIEAYDDAIKSKKFGYIFIDLKQATDDRNRIQTSILPDETRIIYTPK